MWRGVQVLAGGRVGGRGGRLILGGAFGLVRGVRLQMMVGREKEEGTYGFVFFTFSFAV
jgi:hypothetical protein